MCGGLFVGYLAQCLTYYVFTLSLATYFKGGRLITAVLTFLYHTLIYLIRESLYILDYRPNDQVHLQ